MYIGIISTGVLSAELSVSAGSITAMGVALGVCFGLPAVFIIANRHKMMLMPLVCGLASWCAFTYFGSGMLAGSALSDATVGGALLMAAVQSVIIVLGHFLVLKFISNSVEKPGVSLSYGLGYTLIELVLLHGMQLFSKISLATAVNNNGFDKVAMTVDDADALRELIVSVAEAPVYEQLLGGAEILFLFLTTVSVCVFMWYGITRGRYVLVLSALACQLLCMTAVIVLPAYSVIAAEAVYGAVSAASAVLAFRVYRRYEGAPQYSAEPVNRFRL